MGIIIAFITGVIAGGVLVVCWALHEADEKGLIARKQSANMQNTQENQGKAKKSQNTGND